MSNLSELLPTGGGQNAVDFVATGNLASGQAVVLKTDGTVEAITETVIPASVGTEDTYNGRATQYSPSVFDSTNNRVVIFYRDGGNSNYGTAIVGTVSGTNLTFGTAEVFQSANSGIAYSATYDSNNSKVVVAYTDPSNADYGIAKVGTVSGTGITFGNAETFSTDSAASISSTFDSTSNKVIIAFKNGQYGNTYTGAAVVGTVSATGNTITFGNLGTFNTGQASSTATTYDSYNNKVVIAYRNDVGSDYGTAIVGTVSGTGITFGTAKVFQASTTSFITAAFDATSNKVVVAYTDQANSTYGASVVGTVSGTGITFGTKVVYQSVSNTDDNSAAYFPEGGGVVIAFSNGTNNEGRFIGGTVSGTSITFGPSFQFSASPANFTSIVYDSTNKNMPIAYVDDDDGYGKSTISQPGYTTTTNTSFIGITAEAISNGATGPVNVYGGINTVQTGLTIASDYYVQSDGSVSSPAASVPYNIAGSTYVQSFSVASQDTNPYNLTFNNDGTKMFVVGVTGDNVYEYALSTGFDVSTASYTQAFSVASQETNPYGLVFNADGTKMFICGVTARNVNEYALSTGFNVSTASFTRLFSVSSQDTAPTGLAFNAAGTKMFVLGSTGNDVNEYALSTGFNVSTASYTQNFSVSAQETSPTGMVFNPTGTQMFVIGPGADTVFLYTLSAGFDVSTASYSGTSFSVTAQEVTPRGIAFSAEGTKMYIVGSSGDDVNEYSTGAGSVTTVKAGQAISATTINMKDLT